MKLVANKSASVALRESGAIGNTIPVWPNMDEFSRSGYDGPVVIQYREPSSPYCRYEVWPSQFLSTVGELVAAGADVSKMYFSPWIDTESILLYAELCVIPGGLCVNYNTAHINSRDASRKPEGHVSGVAARLLLKRYMDWNSYDWLFNLIDLYDDAKDCTGSFAIEFTVCDKPVGTLKWNTIFWEVRNF